MDIQDYERVMATIKLMGALETGRKSGEEQGMDFIRATKE